MPRGIRAVRLDEDVGVKQVRHQATPRLRVTGTQFEDDLNLFTLRRATVLDVFGSRRFGGKVGAFVAVENVFDAEYDVGRTPILTTGLLRAARAGVQVWLP